MATLIHEDDDVIIVHFEGETAQDCLDARDDYWNEHYAGLDPEERPLTYPSYSPTLYQVLAARFILIMVWVKTFYTYP